MALTFYDRTGTAVAYTEDGVDVYLFDGEPVAYLEGDAVYAYSGAHLGWFEDGWVRDHAGYCVFFTEVASGDGPIKPIEHIRPIKLAKRQLPIRGIRQIAPVKPIKHLTWSELSGEAFFRS